MRQKRMKRGKLFRHITKAGIECDQCLRVLFLSLSLLSDSNQRPRDYKSRALAN